MVSIEQLTHVYPSQKGIFDVTFDIGEGETFGYLGPNGAGKTTTIRGLMGFINPDKGRCKINGWDCRKDACEVQKAAGYLPGEMNMLDSMTGARFLSLLADMRRMKDLTRMRDLVDRFDLDIQGKIKKMSKGMKQKLGIIAAFMHDPAVYILDEPTSGLDPLMQNEFAALLAEEKTRGKTILMSSHVFEEVQKSCDRVGIIKDGRIVAIEQVKNLIAMKKKRLLLTLGNEKDVDELLHSEFETERVSGNTVLISASYPFHELYRLLSGYDVISFESQQVSLEETFMKYYQKEDKRYE